MKDKEELDKELKVFLGLPEIMIGNEETLKIKGIHLLKPTQKQLDQGKDIALDKNLSKVFIYDCLGIYTGVNGMGYSYDQVDAGLVKEESNKLQ